jgi:phosphoribosylformylglycinamidine (FGAM) synthase PurS component
MKTFRVLVEVLPKEEILDPEGEVLRQRLPVKNGITCGKIRVGRSFEMQVSAESEAAVRQQVEQWMNDWLVNSVVQVGTIASIEVL